MAKTDKEKAGSPKPEPPEEPKAPELETTEPEPEAPPEPTTPKRIEISGEELDIIAKRHPEKYAKLVKELGKQTKRELLVRLNSSTTYPPDTVRTWRLEIKAIDDGRWHPNTPKMGPWRAPTRKTMYESIVN